MSNAPQAPIPFEDELVFVLSTLLDQSPEEIRADKRRYAGIVTIDELLHCRAEMNDNEWVDWNTLSFGHDDPNNFVYARSDFDVRHSLFEELPVDDEEVKRMWQEQGGVLLGSQIAALIEKGGVSPEEASHFRPYRACIKSEHSLLASFAHLLRLHAFEDRIDPPEMETYEVDPKWRPMLEQIANPELRTYLGLFFQGGYDSQVGMQLVGTSSESTLFGLPGPYEFVLVWETKDDVGHFLTRVKNDSGAL